jgi:hypothetical protein
MIAGAFVEREQLGGSCRAKEDFNGVDAVVSYLMNKGDNYDNHDNSTSNCVDAPEYVRPCARWDEHGKSRYSPLQHGRCGRPYCKPDPGMLLEVRFFPSRMIQADQH